MKANLFTLFTYKLLVCLFTYFPPSHRATKRNAPRCSRHRLRRRRRRRPSFRFQMHFIECPPRELGIVTRDFLRGTSPMKASPPLICTNRQTRLHLKLQHRRVSDRKCRSFVSSATAISRNCFINRLVVKMDCAFPLETVLVRENNRE